MYVNYWFISYHTPAQNGQSLEGHSVFYCATDKPAMGVYELALRVARENVGQEDVILTALNVLSCEPYNELE